MSRQVTIEAIELASLRGTNARQQWVHVLPSGVVRTRDGRGPYQLENAQQVIAETLLLKGNAKVPVDYDHLTELKPSVAGQAIAAGWVTKFEARADGIWALVEWTEKAAAHVAAREYRYLSPSLLVDRENRIGAIKSIALVNQPNLHELTALNRQENKTMKTQSGDSTDFSREEMAEVRTLLKLSPDAGPQQVLLKLRELAGKADESEKDKLENNAGGLDPSKFVPIELFERAVADANSLRQGIQQNHAVSFVNEHIKAGRLAPAFRDWAVSLCMQNKPSFDAFMEKTGPMFRKITEPSHINDFASLNGAESSSGVESEICQKLGITPEQFKAAQ